jgi:hypothetical protein
MNIMRTGAAGAALAVLTLAAGCGTPGRPAHSVSAPASAAVTAAASPSPATPPGSSAPASARPGFRASDVSFVSAQRGWVLGSGQLLGTDDGALSWAALPAPPAGVTHLRFASSSDGYAWRTGGALWLTTNGAASWQPGQLSQVLSLETASGWVWAIAGQQPYPDVWRAAAGSTAWTNLGYTPDRSATLVVHGPAAYVTGQEGAGPIPPSLEVYRLNQVGRHLAVPCPVSQPVPQAELGASTDGSLVLICDVQSQPAESDLAYASTDGGSNWTAITAPPGSSDGVTAITGKRFSWNANVLVSSGGAWRVALAGPAGGFSLVGFETDQQGVALAANGALWITRNSGSTWSPVSFAR